MPEPSTNNSGAPMGQNRLISLAAGVSPELETDPAAFLRAAADAGWSAAGIWHDADSWNAATSKDVTTVLDDTGLTAVDMEVVRMGSSRDRGEELVDAAAEVGARNILTVSAFDHPEETAERLGVLCRRAEPAGIRVCIEFMRFTSVRTLADALEVVRLLDEANVGILVDLLHVVRSGTTFDEIAATDPHLFPYVQWCDGPAEPRGWETRDLIADALDDRSNPGEGALGANEFEQLFADDVPFSLEVRSAAIREAFPDHTDRARHILDATRRALRARGDH